MKPTVFEFITLIAFIYYEREKCDIVVLEAGIGGEHDSTNVIPAPLECIFMSISLDHTEMLGDTVEKIAKEKSGIIKKGATVISYPAEADSFNFIPQSEDAISIIKDKCDKVGCDLYMPDIKKVQLINSDISGSEFFYGDMKIKTRLCAAHQIANMITAAEAVKHLCNYGFCVSEQSIKDGIYDFTIPGRMEVVSRNPLTILDGGHNEGCLKALKAMAEKYLIGKKITLLMSFMKDKDYESALSIIAPLAENIIFTQTDALRGETPENLCEKAKPYCKNTFCCSDPHKAYKKALSLTNDDSVLIVTGSFYLVSDVRAIMNEEL
jgi:dihydrofolate synthase/folylpolyglutamate synthase